MACPSIKLESPVCVMKRNEFARDSCVGRDCICVPDRVPLGQYKGNSFLKCMSALKPPLIKCSFGEIGVVVSCSVVQGQLCRGANQTKVLVCSVSKDGKMNVCFWFLRTRWFVWWSCCCGNDTLVCHTAKCIMSPHPDWLLKLENYGH